MCIRDRFIYMLIFSFEVVAVEADGLGMCSRFVMFSLSFQWFSVVVL